MGKRGKPPTPTAQLAARGSWRAKTREGEPEPVGRPECPDWMDDGAKQAWDQLLPRLEAMGLAGSVDVNMLARYCTLWARWRQCEDVIKRTGNGGVVPKRDSDGQVTEFKELPQVGRASRLADQLLKIEQQFGMSPSARANLATDTTNQSKDVNDNSESANDSFLRLVSG